MKKIVTITGHKHTKKGIIATKLAQNSDVEYVRPYTARDLPKGLPHSLEAEYNIVLPSVLDDMMKTEKVLSVTEINGHKYVYFEFQFVKPYSVVIADDYAVVSIKDNWEWGDVFTIRLVSDNEVQSDRVGEYLYKHEFDVVFDVDRDDIYELEHLIGEENE